VSKNKKTRYKPRTVPRRIPFSVVGVGCKFGFIDCQLTDKDVVDASSGKKLGGMENGDKKDIGGGCGREGRGISKISTTLEPPTLYPPPKNILFVDDVDARK
jgi:hypothetical protein